MHEESLQMFRRAKPTPGCSAKIVSTESWHVSCTYRVCYFDCLKGSSKSAQALSNGTEAAMVLTLIILKKSPDLDRAGGNKPRLGPDLSE